MAYIDIPSSVDHVNIGRLKVTDFGLTSNTSVSNVVVVTNIYNNSSNTSWDYEAYLINQGSIITANFASNVLHGNATNVERVFIFNGNTFSKDVIESQSFGFCYRPQGSGATRVTVANVRIRLTNTQPPNDIS